MYRRPAPPPAHRVAALFLIVLAIACGAPAVVSSADPAPPPRPTVTPAGEPVDGTYFENKVRPLLAGQCYECHGGATQQAGLRLDTKAGFLKGGKRGVLTGKSSSLLIKAVTHAEGAPAMPPGRRLTASQVEILQRWIGAGAPWPDYPAPAEDRLWSLQSPRAPAPPAVARPEWVRTSVDAFVLKRLQAEKMEPAPPAGKRELVRRLYLDLTGLPPTPEEVRAYFADRRPDAYEQLVDRLLGSPRYGERWARYWLDLVRYADSSGYERDAEKTHSWKYRDWVIEALNRDMPYDEFVRMQLAGDEIPERTESGMVATGFLRLGTWDDEPNDALAYRYERLDDLVHATSTAFLGMTVRCARCHDHKFDPISQKDYYAFAGAFYAGYLDAGDRALLGGPPAERLGYPVLGFTDREGPPPPLHLLTNGDPTREADVVEPGVLSAIGELGVPPSGWNSGTTTTGRRRRLAEWIASPKNPLTARVMVNRIWQGHFGEGLVRSVNNWGTTGEKPSHPELLDWLSGQFVAGAASPGVRGKPWSLKALHRLILLSSSYRMSSLHPRRKAYEHKDSGNRLLWKQNRRRLDADALRDAMLASSGELDLRMGGRGFVPHVSSEALEGLSRKGAEWIVSPVEEQKRRTIYMFLKRALVMPLLSLFDFGDTTQPLGQRDVSIVPTQALTLMNNSFTSDRSLAMARRIVSEAGGDQEAQVKRAWLLALGRSPTPDELAAGSLHLAEMQTTFDKEASLAGDELRLPQDPVLWLRADRGVELDDERRLIRWRDQSSRGLDISAMSQEARPAVVSLPGGAHAIRFDGAGRFLNVDHQVIRSQQWTVAALVTDRKAGAADHRTLFSNWQGPKANVGTSIFLGLTGGGTVRVSDAFPAAGQVTGAGRPFLLTASSALSGTVVYQDRREIGRLGGPLPPRKLDGPYTIGQQGNINGEYWNGDLLELLVWDRALNDLELQSLWNRAAALHRVAAAPPARELALASLCRVLFNSNEFCFVD